MKDLFDDDPFTAQERALLAAWDRHNARVAANDEYDADFEDRLIAAYQVAQEAALRIAETDDGAICRQIAADARAAGGGAHSYAHVGPTCDHSLDAGFTQEKTLQQSDVGSR